MRRATRDKRNAAGTTGESPPHAPLIKVGACIVVLVVLIAGGASYRIAVAKVRPLLSRRILLPVPLGEFPLQIAGWTGEDRPMSPEVERIAGNDDYVYRVYTHDVTKEKASFYIAYSGRPRTMVGHNPQACYGGQGWISEGTPEEMEIVLASGVKVPALLHRFKKPSPELGSIVVLNYYILNGLATNKESEFSGIMGRFPNIAGDPAKYVAQVQIGATNEVTVRKLGWGTAKEVLAFLPDAEGVVEVASEEKTPE